MTAKAGWINQRTAPRGPNGRLLCRWCDVEVKPPRVTFCSKACVHEHKLRSDPGYVRKQVWKRDHGLCALCQADTVAQWEELTGHKLTARHTKPRGRWQADHIIPVVEGGGECGLENYRTLCTPCHKGVTAELRKRLQKARA